MEGRMLRSSALVVCVVLIKVDRVDKANVDPLCLPCVVLDKNEHDAYLVGCKGGVLKTRYFRGDLRFDSLKTPVSYGLDKILLDWKTIPRDQTISVREGMAAISPVGGQGHVLELVSLHSTSMSIIGSMVYFGHPVLLRTYGI